MPRAITASTHSIVMAFIIDRLIPPMIIIDEITASA